MIKIKDVTARAIEDISAKLGKSHFTMCERSDELYMVVLLDDQCSINYDPRNGYVEITTGDADTYEALFIDDFSTITIL